MNSQKHSCFIAVDYLIYTHEVVGNIVESYPIGLISGWIDAAFAWTGLGYSALAWASHHVESHYAGRAVWLLFLLTLPARSPLRLVDFRLKEQSANRYVNAPVSNSILQFSQPPITTNWIIDVLLFTAAGSGNRPAARTVSHATRSTGQCRSA